ncbi:MAG: hypothetical protein Q8Q40_05585 [Methylococcaceae bacterium]|nr:hypothetical protein [Methylococcaceae bacterium]MDP3903427.1 hypothetical protein [Methylococcaceae bacterium]
MPPHRITQHIKHRQIECLKFPSQRFFNDPKPIRFWFLDKPCQCWSAVDNIEIGVTQIVPVNSISGINELSAKMIDERLALDRPTDQPFS